MSNNTIQLNLNNIENRSNNDNKIDNNNNNITCCQTTSKKLCVVNNQHPFNNNNDKIQDNKINTREIDTLTGKIPSFSLNSL